LEIPLIFLGGLGYNGFIEVEETTYEFIWRWICARGGVWDGKPWKSWKIGCMGSVGILTMGFLK
jgi:hypothetical protein